jgi:hypothetical protein
MGGVVGGLGDRRRALQDHASGWRGCHRAQVGPSPSGLALQWLKSLFALEV